MTICMAGICSIENERECVIMASDRMLTETGTLKMEFEVTQTKAIKIKENCMILSAGSALVPSTLERELASKSSILKNRSSIYAMVQETKKTVKDIHQEKVADEYLHPVGLDIDDYPTLANTGLGGALYEKLKERILNIYLLVGGVDSEGGHIHLVMDPGNEVCFDDIGFHAIGTGERHARSSLIFNDFGSKEISLFEAVFLMYEAKKRAEFAPGVGSQTDMWVISRHNLSKISEEHLELLEKLREKRETADQHVLNQIKEELCQELKGLKENLQETSNK